jgi:hypothetical protein
MDHKQGRLGRLLVEFVITGAKTRVQLSDWAPSVGDAIDLVKQWVKTHPDPGMKNAEIRYKISKRTNGS